MELWVQHKSGIGEKWEVVVEVPYQWKVSPRRRGGDLHWLPKSEYVRCDPPTPPERWVDVTLDCDVASSGITLVHNKCRVVSGGVEGYRLRKVKLKRFDPVETGDWKPGMDYVDQWAFIVEQKEQP